MVGLTCVLYRSRASVSGRVQGIDIADYGLSMKQSTSSTTGLVWNEPQADEVRRSATRSACKNMTPEVKEVQGAWRPGDEHTSAGGRRE
jgi:acylphosphatase